MGEILTDFAEPALWKKFQGVFSMPIFKQEERKNGTSGRTEGVLWNEGSTEEKIVKVHRGFETAGRAGEVGVS